MIPLMLTVKRGAEVTCVLQYCISCFVSPLTLQYYISLVSFNCSLEQEALFFYSSSPIPTALLKYLETVGLMDYSFFVQHKNLMPFGILAPSMQKSIIIVPQHIGTILDNTQEIDLTKKRLAWNFNMQIVTSEACS